MELEKFVLPGVHESDLELNLMHRFESRKFRYESALESEEIQDVADEFDAEEAEGVKNVLEKAAAEKIKEAAGKEAGINTVLSHGAGLKKKKKGPPLYEVLADGMTEGDAWKLLPPAKGVRVEKDVTLHMRWAI